jgi:hypothetical protein
MNSDYASISQSGQRIGVNPLDCCETRLFIYIGTSLLFCGLPCLDVSLSVRDETVLLGRPNDKPALQDRCEM